MTILTVTVNPSIDVACSAPAVQHTRKVRTSAESYAPGGGGINVARVLTRLGADVTACYLAGGISGPVFDALLAAEGVKGHRIDIADDTRMSFTVFDEASGKEYRFVPEGPQFAPSELAALETYVADARAEWLVLSGSLPGWVQPDLYVRLKALAAPHGTQMALDTSGEALAVAMAAGGWDLVKPSLGEFESLTGARFPDADPDAIGESALQLVRNGAAARIVVSMGHRGALMATAAGYRFCAALPVEAHSAVGAGDSFVAAMVDVLARGGDDADAFRAGMAAGTAAVLTPGSNLAHRQDIARLCDDAKTMDMSLRLPGED